MTADLPTAPRGRQWQYTTSSHGCKHLGFEVRKHSARLSRDGNICYLAIVCQCGELSVSRYELWYEKEF